MDNKKDNRYYFKKIIADLAYLHQKQKLETELLALLAMAQEEKTCLLGQLHRLPSRVNC